MGSCVLLRGKVGRKGLFLSSRRYDFTQRIYSVTAGLQTKVQRCLLPRIAPPFAAHKVFSEV